MSYERLTQIDINKEGLPQDGQVFSLVKTRQTVWAQRQKSEHNPGSAYTLAGVLPENAAGKLASVNLPTPRVCPSGKSSLRSEWGIN